MMFAMIQNLRPSANCISGMSSFAALSTCARMLSFHSSVTTHASTCGASDTSISQRCSTVVSSVSCTSRTFSSSAENMEDTRQAWDGTTRGTSPTQVGHTIGDTAGPKPKQTVSRIQVSPQTPLCPSTLHKVKDFFEPSQPR